MNASPIVRFALLLMLGAGCLFLFGGAAPAAGVSAPALQANFIMDFAADRGHMIQISLVFVALGCALIWWYR